MIRGLTVNHKDHDCCRFPPITIWDFRVETYTAHGFGNHWDHEAQEKLGSTRTGQVSSKSHGLGFAVNLSPQNPEAPKPRPDYELANTLLVGHTPFFGHPTLRLRIYHHQVGYLAQGVWCVPIAVVTYLKELF